MRVSTPAVLLFEEEVETACRFRRRAGAFGGYAAPRMDEEEEDFDDEELEDDDDEDWDDDEEEEEEGEADWE